MSLFQKIEQQGAQALMKLPQSVLRKVAGPPRVVDGQTLDLNLQFLIRLQELRRRPDMQTLAPADARTEYNRSLGLLDGPTIPMRTVQDISANGVPVRVYTPEVVQGVFVYLHGGGGVIGSLDGYEVPCRVLANTSQCVVISADYRLAPEHIFPAGLEDSHSVYRWAVEQAERLGGTPKKVAIGGDSFGGSLSALVAQQTREMDLPNPVAQTLFYPACDFTRTGGSRDTFAKGYLLDKELIAWFRDLTFKDTVSCSAASPLLTPRFDDIGPTLIITAGFDPLRDEAQDYAEKLGAAGTKVEYVCEPSLTHGFISMGGVVPAAQAALVRAAEFVKVHTW